MQRLVYEMSGRQSHLLVSKPEKIVYVPHDNTIIEYIERDYVNPKNMTELLECLNKKGR